MHCLINSNKEGLILKAGCVREEVQKVKVVSLKQPGKGPAYCLKKCSAWTYIDGHGDHIGFHWLE